MGRSLFRDGFGSLGLAALALLALGHARPARASQAPPAGGKRVKLTLAELTTLAQRHGFPDPALAAAIAMAESGGNTAAQNNTLGHPPSSFAPGTGPENSIGLWQINVHANPRFAGWNLTDPDENAKAAFIMSQSGTNWHPWSTYNRGLYKPYYPGGTTP